MDEQQRIEGVSIALRDVHETRERTDTHHTETDFVSRRRLFYNLHVPIRSTVGRRDSYDVMITAGSADQRTRPVSPLRGISHIASVLGRVLSVSNDHANLCLRQTQGMKTPSRPSTLDDCPSRTCAPRPRPHMQLHT
jgi:hypothetical protein